MQGAYHRPQKGGEQCNVVMFDTQIDQPQASAHSTFIVKPPGLPELPFWQKIVVFYV